LQVRQQAPLDETLDVLLDVFSAVILRRNHSWSWAASDVAPSHGSLVDRHCSGKHRCKCKDSDHECEIDRTHGNDRPPSRSQPKHGQYAGVACSVSSGALARRRLPLAGSVRDVIAKYCLPLSHPSLANDSRNANGVDDERIATLVVPDRFSIPGGFDVFRIAHVQIDVANLQAPWLIITTLSGVW
jgi:hypothetical protein